VAVLANRRRAQRWYDVASVGYDAVTGPVFWPLGLQRDLLADLDLAGKRVLDVGCGTGRTARLLATAGATVVGVDQSDPQIRRASRRTSDGVDCLQGDAHALPFADGSFDAVVSVGAVLYFPDPEAALTEARRVTRPGGRILVAGFNDPTGLPTTQVEAWWRMTTGALFETFDDRTAGQLFRSAGWSAVESREVGPTWHPRLAIATTATRQE